MLCLHNEGNGFFKISKNRWSEFKSEDCVNDVAEATGLSCWEIVVAESAFRRYAGGQQPYSQLELTACGQAEPQEKRQHWVNIPMESEFESEHSSEESLDLNLLWRLSAAAKK